MSVKAYRKIVLTSRRDVLFSGSVWSVRTGLARLAAEHMPDGVTVDGALGLDDLRRVFPGY